MSENIKVTKQPEEENVPKTYTEEQMREIYNEGQRSGYIAAIKNIRSNINDYLDSLIVAASMQNKGE
jgi:glycyl-tRNA synthetase beta subunit